MEGPINGMFQSLPSNQHNSKPYWHLVDLSTGDAAMTNQVYVFWSVSSGLWNIGPSLDDNADAYGFVNEPETMMCPPDKSRYWTSSDGDFSRTGFIFQVLSAVDAVCIPVGG
eukprot:CAMPEP_0113861160 /NCGR_PEP_ID=MMETSP0372-20130328/14098_1 /TAXON_ID=340204 /ORGANISM="Lankesteria abbotti" /LENGTH=111 /DNA_ID=CAMNT_0000841163 /DNA_START=62 /DNA_END=394 /DNA_ORIENTATION=- /assembly_acc=CAM_ASM_000359